MLAGYNDSIGQSIFSILIPSAGVYFNRDMIRNLSAIIGQIAKEMAKAISAQTEIITLLCSGSFRQWCGPRLIAG